MVTLVTLSVICHHKKYYMLIDCMSHNVHSIPITHLICNWRFISLNLSHLLVFSPCPSVLWRPPVCSLYLWLHFCFVRFGLLFWFLDSTYMWNHTLVFVGLILLNIMGIPCGSDSNKSTCNAGDLGLILGSGRSPGERNDNPLQYSCLRNPMDRGALQAQSMGLQRVEHESGEEDKR